MKSTNFLFILSIAFIAGAARANTSLTVVGNYSASATTDLWKDIPGLVPKALLITVNVPVPSRANQAPYAGVFLQDDLVVVCSDECDRPQPSLTNFANEAGKWQAIKASTVYYWVHRLMESMAQVGFHPQHRLIVRIDRDVENPTNGVAMDNNAFFNPADWTLSFLPVRGLITQLLIGFRLSSPAVDPSVAMHETMHSVFQQAVGPILNPEIYGLHEAFADYFALDVLGDSRLGLIFGSGHALRSNDHVLTYREGLEAHKLGNIVASALWKIRGILPDPVLGRRIAFRAIEKLGERPYSSAGDIASIHLEAARELGLDSTTLARVAGIWTESKLQATPVAIDRLVPSANMDAQGAFSLVAVTQTPPKVALAWGLPSTKVIRVAELASVAEGKRRWEKVSVQEGSGSARELTVLEEPESKKILAVLDSTGHLLPPMGPDRATLEGLAAQLSELRQWRNGGYNEVAGLLTGQGPLAKLRAVTDLRQTQITLRINGRDVNVERETFNVTANWIARFGGTFMGSNYEKGVRSIESASVDTVDAKEFPRLATYEVRPGRRLVGIGIRNSTGLVTTSTLTGFDVNHAVLVPPPVAP